MRLLAFVAAGFVLQTAQSWAQDAAAGVEIEAGATLRMRAEAYDAQAFGATGPGDDDYVLWRALANVTVKSRDAWTAKLELGWHDQAGRDRGPSPTDEDELDIRQAYVDVQAGAQGRLRIGRQELTLGSSRLVSARDGPNIRRVFDGALFVQKAAEWRGQIFLVRPVEDRGGAFDDRSDAQQLFGGVYLTRTIGGAGVDLYYLGLKRDAAAFGIGRGPERRHSAGARVFGHTNAWDYNIEAVGQWGTFRDLEIRAWTLASDVGVTLEEHRFRPRLGLRANVTSGDRVKADGRLETFNPLFPNLSYFNDAALLAPQNHLDLHPSVTLTLNPKLVASAAVDWFWKTARADDVYRGPGLPVGASGASRSVGRQLDLSLTWRPTDAVEFKAAYVRFDVGRALSDIGGQNVNYGMLSLQSRF